MARKTKVTETALVPWDQEMAEAAARAASVEKPTGGYKAVHIRSGVLMIDDEPVEDNELRVVVLASVHENQFFADDYDPGATSTPVCYAFGDMESADPEDEMVPHEEAPDKQSDACKGCPMNEWGSSDRGKGKACKNVRRLALMVADEDSMADAEAIENAEVRSLKVSVTSVKGWAKYVRNKLADLGRPPYGVVTKIKVVPDPKNQFKILFSFESMVDFDGETYAAMKKKVAIAQKEMVAPYPVMEAEEQPKKGRGKTKLPQVKGGAKGRGVPQKATRRKF